MVCGRRQEYINSRLYKIVFLLSGYRSLMKNGGLEVISKIKKYRMSQNRSTGEMNNNSIILIDTGVEILDEEEVRIYAEYVADFMNYDSKRFFSLIDVIARSTNNPDRMSPRAQLIAQSEAIYEICRDM